MKMSENLLAKFTVTQIIILVVLFVYPTAAFATTVLTTAYVSNVTAAAYVTTVSAVAYVAPVSIPVSDSSYPSKLNKNSVIAKETQYGKSGNGIPLRVTSFIVPNAKKTVLVTFEIHGFEDNYARDGTKLVNIGKFVVQYFKEHPKDLKNTNLYVVCSANPDGLAKGWTNNGPGRCQTSLKVDLNRDFDYCWNRKSNSRNKTLTPFSAPESRALRDLVINIQPTDVIDVHGWLNTTFGSPNLCAPFRKAYGLGRQSGLSGTSGYFSGWAMKYAKRTALIELPNPNASAHRMVSALKAVCQK